MNLKQDDVMDDGGKKRKYQLKRYKYFKSVPVSSCNLQGLNFSSVQHFVLSP